MKVVHLNPKVNTKPDKNEAARLVAQIIRRNDIRRINKKYGIAAPQESQTKSRS